MNDILKEINLSGNNISDDGCIFLNEILQNSKIEKISLQSF
jgi:Ran GTPase-activating protein (RanGAP) involved in mRNA processing and transport